MNQEYYYGIILGGFEDSNRKKYISKFVKNKQKLCEFKVKLLVTEENDPVPAQTSYTFEILEIIMDPNDQDWPSDCEIGDKIYAWNSNENQQVHWNPKCGINDDGCLNCSGDYCALVIPWSEYQVQVN